MSTSDALFDPARPVAALTFNRPQARNALTWEMYDALTRACDHVDADPEIRVLVIRAAGDAFAAGTDISQFTAFTNGQDGVAYERRLDAALERLERVRVPTIAEVQGVAAGAGAVIALACDLRVCSRQARFGVPIARTLGNCLSAANCARLIDHLGPAVTKDLLFTGRLIDADEALAHGLVTRLVDLPDLSRATEDLAQKIATHAPLTLHATKEALRRLALARRPPDGAIDDLITDCYGSADFREGVAAFLAKRRPQFRGD
jgi:enoyl-CoA hydratase/carnithine racemase